MNCWRERSVVAGGSAKSIYSHVIFHLLIHELAWGSVQRLVCRQWPDLEAMQVTFFLFFDATLDPGQFLHIHHDNCHLLCSLVPSYASRGSSARSVDVFKQIHSPRWQITYLTHVKAASRRFPFRHHSFQPTVTWWSPPPLRLHFVNMDYHQKKCHPE